LVYAVSVRKQKNTSSPPSGQNATKVGRQSYTPISDALSQPNTLADNEFSDGLVQFNLVGLLSRSFKRKRRNDGVQFSQIVMTLLVWPILKVSSIHCFCQELGQYLRREGKRPERPEDIIYDFWACEDINWRSWACNVSRQVGAQIDIGSPDKSAFVVDDTLKGRRGKKVEGTSRHYDHNRGITIAGHQCLELGLAGENGFLPVDRQLFMGNKGAVDKDNFKDNRSAAAQDMKRARDENKHQMLARMLKAAIKNGHKAAYLIGDAWFGTKANIALAVDHDLKAIFQMKRGKLNYRVNDILYSAAQLHALHARRMKATSAKARFKMARIEAELNLETRPGAEPVWQSVVLILSAPNDDNKENWVLFLSTDTAASSGQILEIYALRWSVEVYFKELKQNFGLLAEQSGKYQVAYASVHLAAVRYLVIYAAMLRNGSLSFGQLRDLQSGKLLALSYAGLLWGLFRAIISGVFDQFEEIIGAGQLKELGEAIDGAVERFLCEALQITPSQVKAIARAEADGRL